jgi:hypothetical protein
MHKNRLSANDLKPNLRHSTQQHLQGTAYQFRQYKANIQPTEVTRWKNLQRNGRYQKRHLENPIKRASERYLNRLRVRKCLQGNPISGSLKIE